MNMTDMTDVTPPNPAKSNGSFLGSQEPYRPQEPAAVAEPAREQSILGKNIKFRGELMGTEDLHIEGTVEGTVKMEGQNLSIGEGGEINANVHAESIVINGKLTGDVLANEIIQIRKSAVVKGNLIAPRIQLDDGGKFRGSMDMVDTDQEMKERHAEFRDKLVHPDLPARPGLAAEAVNHKAPPSGGSAGKAGLDNKDGGNGKEGGKDAKKS